MSSSSNADQTTEAPAPLHSMEVRWFRLGTPPDGAEARFAALGPVQPEAERVDTYLHPSGDDLGIKLREGRLEIKRRSADLGLQALGPELAGRLEVWSKWGFALENPSAAPADGWIRVRKSRRMLRYETTGGRLVALAEARDPESGCSVESATIHLAGQAWWSVGFEASGPAETLEASLRLALDHLVGSWPFGPFGPDDSASYPAWLRSSV